MKATLLVLRLLAIAALVLALPVHARWSHDRSVACNWALLAIEHSGAEGKLYAADYAEQRCEMPGLLKEVEAAVCDIWKAEDGASDAECKQWLAEFKSMRGSVNKLPRGRK